MVSSRSILSVLLRLVAPISVLRDAPAPAPSARPDRDAHVTAVPDARTVEIDPRGLRGVHLAYSPSTDGAPDPGEIVWTWVPYEENDGRGKDRPVLVVAAEPGGSVLAVRLTSKEHAGFLPVGSGDWDGEGRASYVDVERVFRVRPAGMRRESVALPRAAFDRVSAALASRYGWR